jgi:hypothetical protein
LAGVIASMPYIFENLFALCWIGFVLICIILFKQQPKKRVFSSLFCFFYAYYFVAFSFFVSLYPLDFAGLSNFASLLPLKRLDKKVYRRHHKKMWMPANRKN